MKLLLLLRNADQLMLVALRLARHWNCNRTSYFNKERITLYYQCEDHHVYYKMKTRI